MQINTATSHHSQAALPARKEHTLPNLQKQQILDAAAVSGNPADSSIAQAEEPVPADNAKGVLRLLQDGHFKGVADLRLRINFQQELQSIHTQNQGNLLQEKTAGIVNELGNKIDDLDVETLENEENPLIAFQKMVTSLFGQEGEKAEPATIIAKIESGFKELVSSLQPIPLVDNPEAGSVSVEQDGTVTSAGQEPLQQNTNTLAAASLTKLTVWFDAQMEELHADINKPPNLPPVSAPSGQGGGYSKFLTIYNENWGTTGDSGQEGPELSSDGVDTEV